MNVKPGDTIYISRVPDGSMLTEGPLEIHRFIDQDGSYKITINQIVVYQSVFRLGAGTNPYTRLVIPIKL